jgi:hypothetical protein
MSKPSLDSVLLVTLGLAAVIARLWLGPHVVDDAYITFRYARNIAAGLGFTFNPPVHVLGTTTPLFTLLMVAPALLGWSAAWTALALATVADLVTLACGVVVLERHGWRLAALAYAFGLAFWPSYLTCSVSGMETSLYVALLALTWLAVDYERPGAACAAVAFATLCRPDALIAAVVLFGWILHRHPRSSPRCVGIFVAILAPWAIFSLGYFHTIVPASVAAKAHGRLPIRQSLLVFASQFCHGYYGPLTVLAAIGAAILVRSRRAVFVMAVGWWMLYAMAFVSTGAFSYFRWYFVPLFPLYLATIGVALEAVASRVIPRRAMPGIVSLLLIAGGALMATRLPQHRATLLGWANGRESLYESVARENLRGFHCTLAATEIGTFGYYYEGPVLDLIGLVSPEAVGKPIPEILALKRPCWVATYDDHIDPGLLMAADFRDHYELALSRRIGPTRQFLLYRRRAIP